MSNSSLVTYKLISPYKYIRQKKITGITIHHMAGKMTARQCGQVFQWAEASTNYGIGYDGSVGLYVPEDYSAWACASYSHDQEVVNIELSNDGGASSDWHVPDKVIEKCIDLCVDICKRNGIKKLNYTGDKSGNLTMHCWYAATACPGPYLKGKFAYIAQQVNKQLTGSSSSGSSSSLTGKSFLVKVSISDLRIRKGPGTGYGIYGYIKPGVYTITETRSGTGSKTGWGKLKSGVGWISLDFAKRL